MTSIVLGGTSGFTSATGFNLRGTAVASSKMTHNDSALTFTLRGKLSFNSTYTTNSFNYRALAMQYFWNNRSKFIRIFSDTVYPGDRNVPANTTNSYRNVASISYNPFYSNFGTFNNQGDDTFISTGNNIDGRGTIVAFGGAPGATLTSLTAGPTNDGGTPTLMYSANSLVAHRITPSTGQPSITRGFHTFARTNTNNDGFAGQVILPFGIDGHTSSGNAASGVVQYSRTVPAGGAILLFAYSAATVGVSHSPIITSLSGKNLFDMSYQAAPASVFYFQLVVNTAPVPQVAYWDSANTDAYGNFSSNKFPFNINHVFIDLFSFS